MSGRLAYIRLDFLPIFCSSYFLLKKIDKGKDNYETNVFFILILFGYFVIVKKIQYSAWLDTPKD